MCGAESRDKSDVYRDLKACCDSQGSKKWGRVKRSVDELGSVSMMMVVGEESGCGM